MTWQREGRLRSDKSASFVVEFVPRLRSSSFLVFLLGVSFFFSLSNFAIGCGEHNPQRQLQTGLGVLQKVEVQRRLSNRAR